MFFNRKERKGMVSFENAMFAKLSGYFSFFISFFVCLSGVEAHAK